jgi:hypothetical protein
MPIGEVLVRQNDRSRLLEQRRVGRQPLPEPPSHYMELPANARTV